MNLNLLSEHSGPSRFSKRLTTLLACVLLASASCTTGGDGSDPTSSEKSSDSSALPDRKTTKNPGDNGTAKIGETAATALKKSDFGSAIATPLGVEVTNTSESDILYSANLELILRGENDESYTSAHNDIHILLPGETVVYGYVEFPEFKSTSLDATVSDMRWYPMSKVDELGIDLRVKMIDSKLTIRDGIVVGEGEFETFIDRKNDGGLTGKFEFFRRVVMRDADGKLLGVYDDDGKYADAESAGKHTTKIEIEREMWPPNANEDKSTVAISWYSGFFLDT